MKVIGSGVGGVTENDVQMAHTSKALIYAFGVATSSNVRKISERDKVSIREFQVIYELIDDAKDVLSALLSPEIKETEFGKLVIRGVFRTTKDEVICGGEVLQGKAVPKVKARIMRDKEHVADVFVQSVQRQQQEAKEVFEGEMCGLNLKLEKKFVIEEGDRLEFYSQEEVQRSL